MTHCPHCGGVLDDAPRSMASHHGYFAELQKLYDTMPYAVTERLPNFEMFRKFCLIRTGWRDEVSYPCATKAEAQRLAAICRQIGDFAIVTVEGATVTRWTAKSQSMRAMGKAAFQRSREDVEAYARSLLGVTSSAIGQEAA